MNVVDDDCCGDSGSKSESEGVSLSAASEGVSLSVVDELSGVGGVISPIARRSC
jgi:hypothetical protein